MSAHCSTRAPSAALDDAYALYILAVTGCRPKPLRALNSPAALQARAAEIEVHMQAFAAFMTAVMADTAQNMWFSRDEANEINATLQDLASDVRGTVLRAIEDRGAA